MSADPGAGGDRGSRRRFARFVLAGGAAALVNIGSRIALDRAMPFGTAVLVAYACGMLTAWVLTRTFVFEPSGVSRRRELGRFAAVNLAGACVVWIVSEGLERFLFPRIGMRFHPRTVAHAIGVMSPVAGSYLAHLRFSFAPAPGAPAVTGTRSVGGSR